ncbi:MAG: ABC transporter permease [Candidatus Tectomicrobia bacterium]|uniref:ABC transporter permease n=1 Tax=Tectimicrobiota bacterium TaxID=2528274 RepID=A0A933GLY8_UNCTE|nr:ABC transporter permease [Candidatus Tectomicrobia bacterium]
MLVYIIRRLLLALLTLVLVSLIVFVSIRFIPGDLIDQMVKEHVFASVIEKDKTVEAIKHKLGLDVPIYVQYIRWIGGIILHGNLGVSLWKGTPVMDEILSRLPVSLELTFLAIVIAILEAIPLGVYSAARQDTVGDYIARSIAISFIAIPMFWLGVLVTVLPSVWWGWTPPLLYVPFFESPMKNLAQLIIPALILGLVLSGISMRMTRTMMLEVLRQDYIRTAWSKGLREWVVIGRHALKNALIPVITIIGVQVPYLFAGAVVIEQIFNLPGIGRLTLESISNRDYTIISGVNLLVASIVLVVNLAVDLIYAYLDPRVHYK